MGEELKESKIYFKTSEDDSEWNELKGIKNEGGFPEIVISQLFSFEKYFITPEKFNNKFAATCEVIIDKDLIRHFEKLVGLSPLSKKRTRKLLMAHGFDRDTAQTYADTMKPRNMWEINELIKIKEEHIDE